MRVVSDQLVSMRTIGTGLIAGLLFVGAVEAQVNWDAWRPRVVEPDAYPELLIEPRALADELTAGRMVVVDARPSRRFLAGRIAGAQHLDARALATQPDSLAVWFARAGVGDTTQVTVYADAADPAAAGRLFWLLELAGHARVQVLRGGLEAWSRAGLAVHQGPAPPVEPASFTAVPDTSRLATTPWLRLVFADRTQNILDWRSPQEWAAGHIPHSLPLALADLLDDHGQLPSGPEVRAVFARWGPRPREYVNLTLGLVILGDDPPGRLPVHPYLAGRVAGIEEVRVHPGGYADWQAAGAPVVTILTSQAVRDSLRSRWPGSKLQNEPPPDLILLDLRGEREFLHGHLPGAVLLPIHQFEAELLRVVAEHWPQADPATTTMILYCYGPTCTRSRNASTAAARLGYHRLYWYLDGVEGWQQLGERLVRER